MSRPAAEILRDALELPDDARAALVDSLLESLDTEVDDDVEEAWREEIFRRLQQIDSGAAKMIPWEEVRESLRAQIAEASRGTMTP